MEPQKEQPLVWSRTRIHQLADNNALSGRLEECFKELGVCVTVAIADTPLPVSRLDQRTWQLWQKKKQHGGGRRWLIGRQALANLNKKGIDSHTSLSYHGQRAMAVTLIADDHNLTLGTRKIGIDWEGLRPVREEMLRFYLTPQEQQGLQQLPPGSQVLPQRIKLWTIKEALYKADPNSEDAWFTSYQCLPEDILSYQGGATSLRGQVYRFRWHAIYLQSPSGDSIVTLAIADPEQLMERNHHGKTIRE